MIRRRLLLSSLLLAASHVAAFHPASRLMRQLPCTRAAQPSPRTVLFDASPSSGEPAAAVDLPQVGKYAAATLLEAGALSAVFAALDAATAAAHVALPAPAVGVLFAFLSLRSRFFSTLNNSRPDRDAQQGKATPVEVKRPSWTPPGIAFPIIWLTITGLRATSSAIVFQTTGHLFCVPLMVLALHLSVGDTWNTVNNVERRLGVSVTGVTFVWASVWTAIKAFYDVDPTAGMVLAPSGVWITIATLLTSAIWAINEPRQPLLPQVGDGLGSPMSVKNLFR